MTKIIYNKIEDLLIGENGILIDLRFGYGLKRKKVDNLFEELDKLIKITSKEEFILKSFFYGFYSSDFCICRFIRG